MKIVRQLSNKINMFIYFSLSSIHYEEDDICDSVCLYSHYFHCENSR